MAARPSWQGHLKLSLVTCPVVLFNAISPRGDVHFNLINPDTGNRIRMITVDAGTEEPVARGSLVKGYEVAKGAYVTLTPEEIDSVRLESTRTIEIDRFVPSDEIDRLYWDHPYFLVPDGKLALEPFTVIREAMERSGRVGLGRVVMSQRERLLALEPRDGGIVATTLRTYDEVRDLRSIVPAGAADDADDDMVAIAERIVAQKAAPFEPQRFEDRYEDALRALIAEKEEGAEIVRPEEPDTTVIDLMAALRASLKGETDGDDRPRRKAPGARKAATAAPRRSRRRAEG
jgi:DNA end-binding protein Ku